MNESHKYKLIFFHIPKNAGVSVRNALKIDRKSHKFPFTNVSVALPIDVKANTLESIYESYHKFAIVRNPYERMVSLYNFRRQGNDLYDYVYKTNTAFGIEFKDIFGKFGKDVSTEDKLAALREYGYGVNLDGVANNNTNTENQAEPANASDMFDPAKLSETKMRISKQYLPMSGSSDPSQTAEGEYYSQSLQLLTTIAEATSGTKKATKEVASGVSN